ncbi:MAG: DUF4292 domain-containing protein [Flavobacterium sp.]|jgi:hypothetical protein
MRKIIIVFIGLLFLVSCKTKQSVLESAANESLAASKIISGHYEDKKDFSTLNIRANAKYKDEKQSHSVTADIRIKKDEIIWINVKLLGFPVAKALITPERVSYYEKINNTYFEGDFSLLSNWLGTELDFNKVQNLLIGSAIDDLTKAKYIAKIEKELYQLTEKNINNTSKVFNFEGGNFLLKKETIFQEHENRKLEINYPSHKKQNGMFLPNEINIKAQQKETVFIGLEFKNIIFNENLSYPFSIPSGYDQISVN